MTKTDRAHIAEAISKFESGAAQCANICYNLAQNDATRERQSMSEAVRNHDAARNYLHEILKRYGIEPERRRSSRG